MPIKRKLDDGLLLSVVRKHRRLWLVHVHQHNYEHVPVNVLYRRRDIVFHIDQREHEHKHIYDNGGDGINHGDIHEHDNQYPDFHQPIYLNVHEYPDNDEHQFIDKRFLILLDRLMHRAPERGDRDCAGEQFERNRTVELRSVH